MNAQELKYLQFAAQRDNLSITKCVKQYLIVIKSCKFEYLLDYPLHFFFLDTHIYIYMRKTGLCNPARRINGVEGTAFQNKSIREKRKMNRNKKI